MVKEQRAFVSLWLKILENIFNVIVDMSIFIGKHNTTFCHITIYLSGLLNMLY